MGLGKLVDRLFDAAVRRAAAHQSMPPGTLVTTGHRRDVLFPDERLRDDIDTLRPYFDPFNFLVSLRRDPVTGKVQNLISDGDIEGAKKETRDILLTMSHGRQIEYLLDVTSGLHERRHFHDSFGTIVGFGRQLAIIEDGAAFNQLLDELKREPALKLPLLVWARDPDAPRALKDYAAKRQRFVEWLDVLDGSLQPQTISGHTDAVDTVIATALKGMNAVVPAVALNMVRKPADVAFHVVMPLGARAIMEGQAFGMQREMTVAVFGHAAASALKDSRAAMPRVEENVYMAVDLLLSKHFGQGQQWRSAIQFCLSDLAMMSEEADIGQQHPGWRLRKGASTAKARGGLQKPIEPTPYMNAIAGTLGWPSPADITTRAIRKAEATLGGLPDERGFWSKILGAALETHLEFLRFRKEFPALLADPSTYFASLKFLPPPPIISEGGHLTARGLNQEVADGFALWFLFEHLQRQLLFSTRLPCPIKESGLHRCGGDVLDKKRWKPVETCQFSRLVSALGIPELTTTTAG